MNLMAFADLTLFRQALKLARKIGQTEPLSNVLLQEITPGSGVKTDKQWEEYAANTIKTEFHPANTLAMLPKEQGGVVDAKLRVYGMSNVRVADASVFPIQFAAHVSLVVLFGNVFSNERFSCNGLFMGWRSRRRLLFVISTMAFRHLAIPLPAHRTRGPLRRHLMVD